MSAVASAIAKGTFKIRASVWASSVLPQPVRTQRDVGFLQLDVVVVFRPRDLNPLVVVVDGDEACLHLVLANDVFVQDRVDLLRLQQALDVEGGSGRQLLIDDLVTEVDALVADVDARPAISFFTWRCDLPQKLQSSCSFESVGRVIRASLDPPTG